MDVAQLGKTHANLARVKINGTMISFYVDSGCNKTLLPAHIYSESLGKLEHSSVKLRPYGTNSLLQVAGKLSATLENRNGARHQAVVYVINSQLAEPLLGDADAKALGILKIDANGSLAHQADTVGGIVDSLEASGIAVKASRTENQDVSKEEQESIQKIVEKHPRAFQGVGLLKGVEVKLNVDSSVAPVAAPYRPIPLAYQERLSAHLKELREEGKIEDVGPHEEPLVTYDSQQLDKMLVEHDDEVHVNAVICNDLPDALTKEMVQDATARDQQSQALIKSIKQGYLSKDAELARMSFFKNLKSLFSVGGETNASKRRRALSNVKVDANPEEFWELQGEVGDGAFGKVYKAVHRMSGLVSAAKVCEMSEDDELDNFMVEIDILTEMQHKNVVRLIDAYLMKKQLWMLLEFCDGGAVDSIMVELDRGLKEPQIAYITRGMVEGLQYLHQHKVVHRDIKAGNVLLTTDGGVKLSELASGSGTGIHSLSWGVGSLRGVKLGGLRVRKWELQVVRFQQCSCIDAKCNGHCIRALFARC
ncbi:STE20-like serine/threonine-protein kinase [Amphibalanus amphitrite]|uniref:STE20-like serine/threonine-protein kinase n=1 Tax=Amphibalanus amphitrite TaxID=1232801 RepID=A0A6A4UYM2_AMPAM|nr:STE20-like serine/threonine-protein kinase [Amphibalanus amphitrite]